MAKRHYNKNDLTAWFLEDHATLPAAYVKSCEKFFKKIKQRGLTKKEERLGWITRGHEPQATSDKRQADKVTRCNLFTTMLEKKTERENQK